MSKRDETSSRVVAGFDASDLHRGLVAALAEACRNGVPALLIRTQHFVSTSRSDVLVSTDAVHRERLEARVRVLERSVARSRTAYHRAESDEDAAEWLDDLNEQRRQLREVKKAAADLQIPAGGGTTPLVEADVAVLVRAMENLAGEADRFTRREVDALKTVVPVWRMVPGNDPTSWTCEATVRLPVDGGILELGPLTWPVFARGRGSAAARMAMQVDSERPADPRSKRMRRADLERAGISTAAARVLMNAPDEVLAIVEAGGDPDRLPEWVGPDWRNHAFTSHVDGVYRDPDFAWMGLGAYLRQSDLRQAIVDEAAVRNGFLAWTEFEALLPGMVGTRYVQNTDPLDRRAIRPWRRPFEIARDASGRGGARSIICECGQPARIIARVPEVPRDLLCACGRMPGAADFGLDPDMRFPEAYQKFVRPRDAWMRGLTAPSRSTEAARARGEDNRRRIMGLFVSANELTYDEIATSAQLSISTSRNTLKRLAERGLLVRIEGVPVRWRAP